MNWFKWLFRKELKKVKESNISKDIGEIETVKVDISEPIFAMARSFKDHPSHWKVEKNKSDLGANYTIFDLKTGETFFVKPFIFQKYQTMPDPYTGEEYTYLTTDFHYKVDKTWMTRDENNFLVEEFTKMMDLKKSRIKNIKQARQNKERQRLMEVYK